MNFHSAVCYVILYFVQIKFDKIHENTSVYEVFPTFVLLLHIPPPDEQFLLLSYFYLLLRYFTALPKNHVIARSIATRQSASPAAKGGAMLCIAKKRIPTPVCALARNDGWWSVVAYNNFTNYAVSICKRQEIIPPQTKMNLHFLLRKVGSFF